MRFISILTVTLLPLLTLVGAADDHGGHGGGYCGTTTVTRTETEWVVYSNSDADPAEPTGSTPTPSPRPSPRTNHSVSRPRRSPSQRVSRPHPHQLTTPADKAHTQVHTTITSTPVAIETKSVKPCIVTKTTTETLETCSSAPTQRSYPPRDNIKRDAEAEAEPADIERMSNAERLRRGLPPAKPEKRHDGGSGGYPEPSCMPKTETTYTKTTVTKTVTPTHRTTVAECRWTQTVDHVGEYSRVQGEHELMPRRIHHHHPHPHQHADRYGDGAN